MVDEQDEQTQRTERTAQEGPRVVADRYALIAELGRGGMGVVWRAEDRVIGRHVAIKELRVSDNDADAAVFQERVLREVRTGGKLNDPAVVTVFDVINEGASTFIVMELVEAPTLAEVVRKNGPLAPWEVATIGRRVLSALRAAHEAGIVHRDVKPGNIMVGGNGRVKLTDFGIAQAVDDPRLTTSGMLVGSPAFMAPERVDGREAMAASDLWSLGATLFFAVEGLVPFERPTTAATLHAIMNDVPFLTHTQGPLASAIMGLLIATPEARISAEQADGLLALVDSAPGQSTPNQSTYVQPTPGQSTPPGGQRTAMYQGSGPLPTMVAGAQPRRSSKALRTALIAGTAVLIVGALIGGFFIGNAVGKPAKDETMLDTLTFGAGGQIPDFSSDSSSTEYCLNSPLEVGRAVSKNNWVDCKEPHDSEFYASVGLLGGDTSSSSSYGSSSSNALPATYPAGDLALRAAEQQCAATFNTNVIKRDKYPSLKFRALVPSQQQWEKPKSSSSSNGTRTAYCFVSKGDGTQLTESVREKVG